VVFHAANNDLGWLDSIGVNTTTLPRVIDTQDLARELNAPLGLGKLGEYLGLTCSCLHNAGNDAAYTLMVYFKLKERLKTMEERA
jgi:DNA polymerase III alpha subunit (gram-positive type)